MSQSGGIHFFRENETASKVNQNLTEFLGIRGRQILDLANMGLPIAPGFIIDSKLAKKIIQGYDIKSLLKKNVDLIDSSFPRKYGDTNNPLLLKVVQLPDVHFLPFISIHEVGLNSRTVQGFAKWTGERFAYEEYKNFFKVLGTKLFGLEANEFDEMGGTLAKSKKIEDVLSVADLYFGLIEDKLPFDVYDQLEAIIKQSVRHFYSYKENQDINLAILVQAMTFGNYGKDSFAGYFYTRNVITGEQELDGEYFVDEFHTDQGMGKNIQELDNLHLAELKAIANTIERRFKEIRAVKFTNESGRLWLIDQTRCEGQSTQAELKTLLDLRKKKFVKDEDIIMAMPAEQIGELLYPMIDPKEAKVKKCVKGGTAGSPGAAVGKVFFSSEALIDEYRISIKEGKKPKLILCKNATYADDVKAIELSSGILTKEGGFSSHAPVVARSLGKVALIHPKIKIKDKNFTLGRKKVTEGEWIALDVSYYSEPCIYFDEVALIKPNLEENGLNELMNIAEQFIDGLNVRANADLERDALLANRFGAKGIGLCRTEHMFFNEDKINLVRLTIISTGGDEMKKALDQLLPYLEIEFYKLLKAMPELPITIRLLDAPLHEFLPHTKESMEEFIEYAIQQNPSWTDQDVRFRCDGLAEINPMLGHRGCRLAISYPEIYHTQIRALFKAVARLTTEGQNEIEPEIMIPMVIDKKELRLIRFGKKIEGKEIGGIETILKEVCSEFNIKPFPYKVGTMIELPAAALQADGLARYAHFFSFGTNDLTQTTCGMSRDDISSFLSDYTEMDIFSDNPFQVLTEEVKELITIAVKRGKMTRPDIQLGLCGEHASEPKNIAFFKEVGLDYISCSPYNIPIAKIALAQLNISEKNQNS